MLRLRPYMRQDAGAVLSWLTDERAFHLWSAGKLQRFPAAPEELNAFYDKNADGTLWGFTAFDGERPAGHVMMRYLDEDRKEIRLGLIVVNGQRRGKGYGREMVSMAARYAFDFAGAQRVSIAVFTENPAAIRCYEACGFRRTKGKEPENFSCMGEQWELVELELKKEKREEKPDA
ncbi:MAG TPA: GNAT family N-acetyltransferase [Candidatus Merdisoma merdipullorum]|nr:GNAT family N-acetyltransferase [Candidatus Merdisoma merdipullorum]